MTNSPQYMLVLAIILSTYYQLAVIYSIFPLIYYPSVFSKTGHEEEPLEIKEVPVRPPSCNIILFLSPRK